MLRPTLDNVEHVAALGISRGFGDDWLRFIGYKAWVDGIMGSSGAMFFEPYTHDAGNKGLLRRHHAPGRPRGRRDEHDRGASTTPISRPATSRSCSSRPSRTGLPPHVHAIGDKGNRILLDVYEKRPARRHGLIGDAIIAGGSSMRRSCTLTTSRASAG